MNPEPEKTVHQINLTEAAKEEIKRGSKKQLYRLIEVEYVQGPDVALTKLADKYNLPPSSLMGYAKRHHWKKKREEYKLEVEKARARDPLALRAAFKDFTSHQVQGLAYRASIVLNEELETAEKLQAGILKGKEAEKAKDTVGGLLARAELIKSLIGLGVLVHGPLEIELPRDANFEIVLKKQEVRFKTISDAEVEAPAETHLVEIPEGLTVGDVMGVEGEEFE